MYTIMPQSCLFTFLSQNASIISLLSLDFCYLAMIILHLWTFNSFWTITRITYTFLVFCIIMPLFAWITVISEFTIFLPSWINRIRHSPLSITSSFRNHCFRWILHWATHLLLAHYLPTPTLKMVITMRYTQSFSIN